MDDRPFKFRYANQMAGTFVLLALGLAIAGIVITGRSQGWFEGKFQVFATFNTEEGTFGLKQGSEVLVRNTAAGRVGKIVPNEKGQMEATFVIQERFRQFVTTDSVAHVKKKFGVAGDSFIEIQMGVGEAVQDGGFVVVRQDEEIMATAQKILGQVEAQFQEVVVPLLEEIKQILHNVNLLGSDLQEGKGLAGAMMKDDDIAREVKTSIRQVNGILLDSQDMVREVKKLVTDPKLTGDIREAVAQTSVLLIDSQAAIRESTKLIRGLQRHWLLRKYVKQADESGPPVDVYLGMPDGVTGEAERREALKQARLRNDSAAIVLASSRLAAVLLGRGEMAEVAGLVEEAKAEADVCGRGAVEAGLVEAEWLRAAGETSRALEAVTAVLPRTNKGEGNELRIYAHLLMAGIYMDEERPDEAEAVLEAADRRVEKDSSPVLKAMYAGSMARLMMVQSRPDSAAAFHDTEALHLAQAEAFVPMALALVASAEAYGKAGDKGTAADRYFRAARSLVESGHLEKAEKYADQGGKLATEAGDKYLQRQLDLLLSRMHSTRS